MSDEIRKMNPEQSFRQLFWEQQLQAVNVNNPRQVCWHLALIKWCLHLKFKPSSTQYVLVSLPSHLNERCVTIHIG